MIKMAKPKGKSIHVTWDQMNGLFGCMELQLDQLLQDCQEGPDSEYYEWSRKQLKRLNAINKKLHKAFNIMDQHADWEEFLN